MAPVQKNAPRGRRRAFLLGLFLGVALALLVALPMKCERSSHEDLDAAPSPKPTAPPANLIEITIENPGLSLAEHQVRLVVPRAPAMRPDCDGLRFTDAAGKPLPCWLERCDQKEAVVWVRAGRIPYGRSTLRLRYGEGAAKPVSDGGKTFVLFDDFAKGFDEKRWKRNRDASGGGTGAFVTDGELHVYGGDGNSPGWVETTGNLPRRLAVESRMQISRRNDYVKGGLFFVHTETAWPANQLTGVMYNHYKYNEPGLPALAANRDSFMLAPIQAGVRLAPYWENLWFRQSLAYDGDAGGRKNVVYRRDRGEGAEHLRHSARSYDGPVRLYIGPWAWYPAPNQRFVFDWIAVRNYTPTQLTISLRDSTGEISKFTFGDGEAAPEASPTEVF